MIDQPASTKESNAPQEKTGGGWMGRLVRCFFIVPVEFVKEFFCVYWEIATKPEWNKGDRLMARYFWPPSIVVIVILLFTTPQCVKLEKETRSEQEQPQSQAVPPEKGTTSLGTTEDNLVMIDVTSKIGGVAPDKDRTDEIQDESDKIECPGVHVLNSSTNDERTHGARKEGL